MADIELVINITKHEWEYLNKLVENGDQLGHYERLLVNGTPLPKEHGRLIDADALDEAIKHCEEVAEELEEEAVKGCCDDTEIMDKCLEYVKEHRQLAEWLRALKEIWDSGDCNDCLHQNNCTIKPKPGQLARFNCYQYERGIQNDNDNN